jgi:hypothetical protein
MGNTPGGKGSLDSKGIPTAMKGNYSLTINLSRNFRGYKREPKNFRVPSKRLVIGKAFERTHVTKEGEGKVAYFIK